MNIYLQTHFTMEESAYHYRKHNFEQFSSSLTAYENLLTSAQCLPATPQRAPPAGQGWHCIRYALFHFLSRRVGYCHGNTSSYLPLFCVKVKPPLPGGFVVHAGLEVTLRRSKVVAHYFSLPVKCDENITPSISDHPRVKKEKRKRKKRKITLVKQGMKQIFCCESVMTRHCLLSYPEALQEYHVNQNIQLKPC